MKHYRRFFALVLAGVLLLACAACGGGLSNKIAARPVIMYQDQIYVEIDVSEKDLESEDMSYVGVIISTGPTNKLPKENWHGNDSKLLDADVYLSSIDGTLHLLLNNGRQIKMGLVLPLTA